jgi:hypothetical protein
VYCSLEAYAWDGQGLERRKELWGRQPRSEFKFLSVFFHAILRASFLCVSFSFYSFLPTYKNNISVTPLQTFNPLLPDYTKLIKEENMIFHINENID